MLGSILAALRHPERRNSNDFEAIRLKLKPFIWLYYAVKKLTSDIVDTYSFIHSRVTGKPLVHVIGDSHTGVFSLRHLFIVHHLGPATMHSLNRSNSATGSNEKLFHILHRLNPKRDVVMLVFGEIDCRIHIFNQYEKNDKKVSFGVLIENTITNFGEVLGNISKLGIGFCIYGIPPANMQGNYYNYATYAPPETRSQIYKEFSTRLKLFCQNNGYAYIDFYSEVADRDGFVKKEWLADALHLNGKIVKLVRQQLKHIFQTQKNGNNGDPLDRGLDDIPARS